MGLVAPPKDLEMLMVLKSSDVVNRVMVDIKLIKFSNVCDVERR